MMKPTIYAAVMAEGNFEFQSMKQLVTFAKLHRQGVAVEVAFQAAVAG